MSEQNWNLLHHGDPRLTGLSSADDPNWLHRSIPGGEEYRSTKTGVVVRVWNALRYAVEVKPEDASHV